MTYPRYNHSLCTHIYNMFPKYSNTFRRRTFVIFTNLDKRTHKLHNKYGEKLCQPLIRESNVTNEMSKKDVEVKIK